MEWEVCVVAISNHWIVFILLEPINPSRDAITSTHTQSGWSYVVACLVAGVVACKQVLPWNYTCAKDCLEDLNFALHAHHSYGLTCPSVRGGLVSFPDHPGFSFLFHPGVSFPDHPGVRGGQCMEI